MERKILFLVFGLMSLLTLSSCEDKITLNDENEFMPTAYTVKLDETNPKTADTIQIVGIKGLIFDEMVKDDWKIITQGTVFFHGSEPLKFSSNSYEIENIKDLINLPTNYGGIPIAFGNTTVTYTYMGNQVVLEPLENFCVTIKFEEENLKTDPFFIHYGYINYTLRIGLVPIKHHKQPFMILDSDNPNWDWVDDDVNENK